MTIVKIGKNHKKFSHYKISEIKPGHIVQLNYKKNIRSVWSHSVHIEIMRIDPKGTGMIIGEGIFSDTGKEFLFHADYIYRNYTLDPIRSDTKKQIPFNRKKCL